MHACIFTAAVIEEVMLVVLLMSLFFVHDVISINVNVKFTLREFRAIQFVLRESLAHLHTCCEGDK